MSGCTQYSQPWNTFSGFRSGPNVGQSRTFLRINVVKENDVTLLHFITCRGGPKQFIQIFSLLVAVLSIQFNTIQMIKIPFFTIYLASFRQFLVKSFLVSPDLVVSTSTGLAVVWIITTCWLNYSHASQLDSGFITLVIFSLFSFIFNFVMTTTKIISFTFKNKFFVWFIRG